FRSVFPWGAACTACTIRTIPGKGIGGMGEIKETKLEPVRRSTHQALEAVSLHGLVDDGHESGLARYTGHVSDIPAALLALRPGRTLNHFGHIDDWRHHWRGRGRLSLRP